MTFSIRTTIRDLVAPSHRLSCSRTLWRTGLRELRRRGGMCRESGAFLLGMRDGDRGRITDFVFYDDLDSQCLDTGIVVFDGTSTGYGALWKRCREQGREVIADVHTHGGKARQSPQDRNHPMIAQPGHVALIIPDFAQQTVGASVLGIYEYLGEHCWKDYSGRNAGAFFYIGRWG
jgi:proteasome lid subunit RPN8/RPN11